MMKDFNAKTVEEYAYRAYHKGFFKEWQVMTSSIHRDEELNYDDAAEEAYKRLNLVGSD